MVLTLGIDEAGRGPVIGPLVMCGFLIAKEKVPLLKRMGVRDSKLLSARRREYLVKHLENIADDFVVIKLSAEQIDGFRGVSNLNKLEIEKIKEIIKLFGPDEVIIDAIEANTDKFKKKVRTGIDKKINIIAENFADKNHAVVSAASIIAKFYRDEEIKKLQKQYGDFGSGYTHDPKTIKFLKQWIKNNKEFPPIVRKSWITAIEIKKEKEQKGVKDFMGI